jgi:hypothetical protein
MGDGHDDEIIHRELSTDMENPGIQIAEIIADLEGKEVNELTTVWDCIDGAIAEIFSNPPSAEAQVQVTYSYEGYRVTIEQDGKAKLVKAG